MKDKIRRILENYGQALFKGDYNSKVIIENSITELLNLMKPRELDRDAVENFVNCFGISSYIIGDAYMAKEFKRDLINEIIQAYSKGELFKQDEIK